MVSDLSMELANLILDSSIVDTMLQDHLLEGIHSELVVCFQCLYSGLQTLDVSDLILL